MWLQHIWQDLRHGSRVFARTPGFTAVAVLSIALGTGANVAIFSAVDVLLLRPPRVERPHELLTIGSPVPFANWSMHLASYPDFDDIRRRTRSFSGFAAFTSELAGMSAGPGRSPQVKLLTLVNASFFSVLGVGPMLGRDFRPDEDTVPGRNAVAIISHGMWKQLFDGSGSAVGRELRIGGLPFTVVGVLPESFTGLTDRTAPQTAYVPLAMWPRLATASGLNPRLTPESGINPLTARHLRALTVKGRLRPEFTLAQARAELTTLGRTLEQSYPDTNARQTLFAQTPLEAKLESSAWEAGMLLVTSILSMSVLFVACANVAGLLASRAPLRSREIALRLAIGASRWRLVRQLITESLCIALIGGVAGLGVGHLGTQLINRIEYPTDIFAPPIIRLDGRALLFSAAIAVFSAVLFGLGPALRATRTDLIHSMRSNEARVRGWRIAGQNQLVAMQVALSLAMLTIAAFSVQVFGQILEQGPGFRTAGIAKISIDAGQAGYRGPEVVRLFERVVNQARRMPGVSSAAVTDAMPLFSLASEPILPDGYDSLAAERPAQVFTNSVGEDYFTTLEIPILEGRPLLATDSAAAPPVAVINETFARRHWPEGGSLGQRLRLGAQNGPAVEIVGVARDAKYLLVTEGPTAMVYFPFRQRPPGPMVLLAATDGESASLLSPLLQVIRGIDGNLPVYDVQTMERFYHTRSSSIGGVALSLITSMSAMGVALTVVGLYALVSYAVVRRTREIGIRMAVGATSARVLQLLLRQGMMPAWVGLIMGLGLSLLLTRILPALASVGQAYDVRLFLLAVSLLLTVTLLAAFVPARRAALVNPTEALRHE